MSAASNETLVRAAMIGAREAIEKLAAGDGQPWCDLIAGESLSMEAKAAILKLGWFVGELIKDKHTLAAKVADLEAQIKSVPTLEFADDPDHGPMLKLTQGDKTSWQKIPGLRDKGIWRAGESYRQGDCVSHNRSLFIAQKDHPTGRPEDSSGHWRLGVCRGRDLRGDRE
jgi:hypothetical protein